MDHDQIEKIQNRMNITFGIISNSFFSLSTKLWKDRIKEDTQKMVGHEDFYIAK